MPVHAEGVHVNAVPDEVFYHLFRQVVLHHAYIGVSHFVDGALYVVGAAEKLPLLISSIRVAALSPFIGENPLRADVHRVQHLPLRREGLHGYVRKHHLALGVVILAHGLLIEFVDASADTDDVVIEVFPLQTVHLAPAHPSQHREPP